METAKTIVITGGTSGIGRAAALAFSNAGWRVAICGRRRELLDSAKAEGGLTLAIPADVTDAASVGAFFAAARAELGRLDVVLNNAGVDAPMTDVGDTATDTWDRIISTNLSGAFYVAREAFRIMREQTPQGGRIINTGSIAAYVPRFGAAAYAASKAGLASLTKSIAVEGRRYNIACGQIDPGNPMTEMIRDQIKSRAQSDGSLKPEPSFDVAHVVDAVFYMAGLPLEANVQFMTVMATAMPYIGRG